MSPEEGRNYVNVRRGHVLEDAVAKFRRRNSTLNFQSLLSSPMMKATVKDLLIRVGRPESSFAW
jgi:hypothetical protein